MTTGQQYQEVLTNFPFASQIPLTGVFVEFDVTDPLGNTNTSTHTIVDRFGYASRQGSATATVSLPAGGQPAISPSTILPSTSTRASSRQPCPIC